jgi:hypothetical protein
VTTCHYESALEGAKKKGEFPILLGNLEQKQWKRPKGHLLFQPKLGSAKYSKNFRE